MEKIILTAVGDICPGDSAKGLGFGVKSLTARVAPNFFFEGAKPVLSGDIIFGNLEGVLSNYGLQGNDFFSEQMRGDPQFVNGLKGAGFNVVNVANNHMMQHGRQAFRETVNLLQDSGMNVLGLRGDETYSAPVILKIKGKKIGFLGYSLEKDCYVDAKDVLYANTWDKKIILRDITDVRPSVDWLVLSLHWGVEFVSSPSPIMLALAKECCDAGVNIILGHHPHVLQPVVRRKQSIICYSLGNFIFDMIWNKKCRDSMAVRFLLQDEHAPIFDIIPFRINRFFQPRILHALEKNNVINGLILEGKNLARLDRLDLEKANVIYYKEFFKAQWRDMWLSNLYFLKTLFLKTPRPFIRGKIRYFLNKFNLARKVT